SSLELQFYVNPTAADAGIGACLNATPTPPPNGGSTTSFLFPSPARGASAKVGYTLSAAGSVKILVFNEAGRLVDKVEEQKPAGFQTSALSTGKWAPGVYFYLCTLSPGNGAAQALPLVKFAVIH
ncbi:MAG TPA: T9SS type A sorting domain-containing protein, partial [bacterium]|nr:T9SS type A sorting domain-containing protein [bacterium]